MRNFCIAVFVAGMVGMVGGTLYHQPKWSFIVSMVVAVAGFLGMLFFSVMRYETIEADPPGDVDKTPDEPVVFNDAERADIGALVKKGAAFLDERQPGWYHRIDLMTLDMSHPDDDVLCQIFGKNFFDVLDDLRFSEDQAETYGLLAPDVTSDAHIEAFYKVATEFWAKEVVDRMVADTSPQPAV